MAAILLDFVKAQRNSRMRETLTFSRPALVLRWKPDSQGHLRCSWTLASRAALPPH